MKPSRQTIVYIIGPLEAENGEDRAWNVAQARTAARQLWEAGFAVHCPHLNTLGMAGLIPEEEFLAGEMAILARCDAALVVDAEGAKQSTGCQAEIAACRRAGKPLFSTTDALLNAHTRKPCAAASAYGECAHCDKASPAHRMIAACWDGCRNDMADIATCVHPRIQQPGPSFGGMCLDCDTAFMPDQVPLIPIP